MSLANFEIHTSDSEIVEKQLKFIGGLNHGLEGEGDDDGTDCSSVDKENHPAQPIWLVQK